YASTICHHTDVGGRVPGSNASDSTEIYQEGVRIPPLKFYDRGKRNETLVALIEKNVRLPVRVFGDLRAQLAACHVGEAGVLALGGQDGENGLMRRMADLSDYSDRWPREARRERPAGEFSCETWMDDAGTGGGKPIRLFLTLKKRGD